MQRKKNGTKKKENSGSLACWFLYNALKSHTEALAEVSQEILRFAQNDNEKQYILFKNR